MNQVDVQIRRADSIEDYQSAIELQKEVWGFTEEECVRRPLLLIGNRYGGSVLVAERPDGAILGFAYALLCRTGGGAPFWWSHMTAVVPSWQGKDLGFQLKLAQRKDALEQGIREIWWTFDPLQAVNAHFNLRKLGVTVRRLEENMYGISASPLHHEMPTDRFIAEWRIDSPGVVDRASGEPPVILRDLDSMVRIFVAAGDRPQAPDLEREDSPLVFEIPLDFAAIVKTDRTLAMEWQKAVRTACRHYLLRGYEITDFMIPDKPRRQGLYVLERNAG